MQSDNDKILIENEKVTIDSDHLKLTADGQDVAFIDIGVVGVEVGQKGDLCSKAGKLSASIKLKVIQKKETRGSHFQKSFYRVSQILLI